MLGFFNWDRDFYEKFKNLPNLPPAEQQDVQRFFDLHQKVSTGAPLSKEELDFLKNSNKFQLFTGKIATLNANAINQQLTQELHRLNIASTAQQIKHEAQLQPYRIKEMEAQKDYLESMKKRMESESSAESIRGFLSGTQNLLSINTLRYNNLTDEITRLIAQYPKAPKKDKETIIQYVSKYAEERQKIVDLLGDIAKEQSKVLNKLSQSIFNTDLSSINLQNPLLNNPTSAAGVFQSLPSNEQEALKKVFEYLKK